MNTTSFAKAAFLLSISFLFLTSCSSKLSSSWTDDGYKGEAFSKIAVVGISNDLNARLVFEESAVALLKDKGVQAINGIEVFPAKMSEEEQKPANLIKLIKENNVDAVITMSLVDTREATRYEPGESYNVPAGYYRLGKYVYRRYITVHEPGYYVPTQSYLIEAVLHNLKGELTEDSKTLVWTGQSALVDPSSLRGAAALFTKKMVKSLLEDKVIRTN